MLEPGTTAPDFTLPDYNGNSVTLSDLRGQWVALWFYPKAMTPGCTKESQSFRDMAGDFAAAGVEIFGVSFDRPEDNKSFADSESLPYRLLSDVDKVAGAAYDAIRGDEEPFTGAPRRVTYVIDPAGRIDNAYDVTDIDNHPATVLAGIKAAMA